MYKMRVCSGVHISSRKPMKSVRERKKKNDCYVKKLWKEGLYKAASEDNFNELRVIDSSNNVGTNALVTGEWGGKKCHKTRNGCMVLT